jgi:adenosylmethionine-8-amino-7-oxononanoate aminotransferase
MAERAFVRADRTSVFVRELDRPYPLIERGRGVWLYDTNGTAYLDAVSGGAMVTSLGHGGIPEIMDAARAQTEKVSFIYNVHATSPAQEALASELMTIAPEGSAACTSPQAAPRRTSSRSAWSARTTWSAASRPDTW